MAALVNRMLESFGGLERVYVTPIASVLAEGMDAALSAMRRGERYDLLPHSFKEQVTKTLTDLHRDSIEVSANIMDEEFAEGFKHLELKNEATEILQRFVDRYGSRSAAQIIDTTQRQVENMVLGGMARGEAMESIFARLINRVPDIAAGRAAIITPTEVHTAMQYASQAMAERSQITLKKVWNSVNDDRTRDFFGRADEFNHRIMDGQQVALEGVFPVPRKLGGFEYLQFPGDPAGSPGNIINCRCIQTYERAGNV